MFSFRWTGAALACGVMAFPLLVRAIRLSFEAIDRRLEDAASTLGANGILGVPHRDLAARAARRHRRHGAVPSPRRSASSAPPSPSSPTSPARRRRCRRRSTRSRKSPAATPRRCASSSSPSSSRSRRWSRRSGSPAAPACATTETEMLSVDVEKRLGEFSDRRQVRDRRRRDRAVRPVRRGQDLAGQHDRRPGDAGPRPHRARRRRAVRQRRAASTCRPTAAASACVPGGPAVSAHDGGAEPRLWPLDERRAGRSGRARAHRCAARHRRAARRAGRGSCPAASASAWRSAARC